MPASETGEAAESALRHIGREFLVALHAALRSLQLYPLDNSQVQTGLDHLVVTTTRILALSGELELRLQGEFLFVNATRLRLELDSFAFFAHVFGILRQAAIGAVRIHEGVDRRQLQIFASLLLVHAAKKAGAEAVLELGQALRDTGVAAITVEPSPEREAGAPEPAQQKAAAKRAYAQSVTVTKEVVTAVRTGRVASLKKVRLVVQTIVDQVLNNEVSLVGLTTLRGYDEYTFTHSVNVCIFAVAVGRRLGLTKPQLADLGVAALLHDIGKARVPLDVLHKEGSLSEDDWRILQAHTWLGALALFTIRGYGDIPFRPMVVAYEHHMKIDLTGYPKSIRPRQLSILSKIIAVVDAYDAATSRRSYRTVPVQPDQVLREMWQDRWRGNDPVVVKAFITVVGIYPVGTCVILDTYELAIIHAANPDTSQLHRPVVRVVATTDGALLAPGFLADLSERDQGGPFARTIIKVTDAEKYGIRVSDYFI